MGITTFVISDFCPEVTRFSEGDVNLIVRRGAGLSVARSIVNGVPLINAKTCYPAGFVSAERFELSTNGLISQYP
jgi:hypothetical protein